MVEGAPEITSLMYGSTRAWIRIYPGKEVFSRVFFLPARISKTVSVGMTTSASFSCIPRRSTSLSRYSLTFFS